MSPLARIAIFDLDGTLTRRASFLPFVLFVLERRATRLVAVPRMLAAGALFGLGLLHRDRVKQLIWRQILAGLSRAQAEELAADFARRWAATAVRPGARAALARHRAAGDRIVVATAAMDLVAAPFAAALGVTEAVATRTRWSNTGQVAPGFDGPNCRGPEKLARVQAALGPDCDAAGVVAYSDHQDDLPLLAWAGAGVAVNPDPAFAKVAAARGFAVVDWDVAPAGDGG